MEITTVDSLLEIVLGEYGTNVDGKDGFLYKLKIGKFDANEAERLVITLNKLARVVQKKDYIKVTKGIYNLPRYMLSWRDNCVSTEEELNVYGRYLVLVSESVRYILTEMFDNECSDD
jgi:hypothetical protein